jgi:hypothetical protein
MANGIRVLSRALTAQLAASAAAVMSDAMSGKYGPAILYGVEKGMVQDGVGICHWISPV